MIRMERPAIPPFSVSRCWGNRLAAQHYFRFRRLRLTPTLDLPSRFAFRATCCRYRLTISLLEAPDIKLTPASKAACIFSLTISSASRRALVPPSINLIIRSAMTPFASAANFINGVNCRRLIVPRLKSNSYSAGGLHVRTHGPPPSSGQCTLVPAARSTQLDSLWVRAAVQDARQGNLDDGPLSNGKAYRYVASQSRQPHGQLKQMQALKKSRQAEFVPDPGRLCNAPAQ